MPIMHSRSSLLDELNKELDKFFMTNDLDVMYNVEHTKDAKKVYIDLPGVKKEDVTVTINKQTITVEAERKGFISGKYRKTFTVSLDVDTSKTQLSMEDGVLVITLPVTDQAKPKTLRLT